MTIYKSVPNEKKEDKDVEVCSEPLTGEKDVPKAVRVTVKPHSRRTCCNLFMIIMAVLVLGAGVIGAVFLYRQLAHRVYQLHCRQYYDSSGLMGEQKQLQQDAPVRDYDYFEEDVEVSVEDKFEHLQVPKFDGCEETVVWHDFQNNFTAIVDHHLELCYVMKLNRTLIAPPTDMFDFITKFKDKYYLPRASVIRNKYRVVLPPVADLTKLGPFIMRACFWYETFMLQKIGGDGGHSGIERRSVGSEKIMFVDTDYGFSTFKDSVMRMTISHPAK